MPFTSDPIALRGDTRIAIERGSALPPPQESFLGFALFSVKTVGHAVELLTHYPNWESRPFFLERQTHRDQVILVLRIQDNLVADDLSLTFYAYQEIARIALYLRMIMGHHWQASRAYLTPTLKPMSPSDTKSLELFQCPVSHSQRHCAIQFDVAMLALNSPIPNAEAEHFCHRMRQYLLKKLSVKSLFIDKTRLYLLARPGTFPNVDELASLVETSPSTLRRVFKQNQCSYQSLLQEVRYCLAQEYLLNSNIKLEDIALLLSYNTSANFSHAFRRWSGQSPKVWRSRQRMQTPQNVH